MENFDSHVRFIYKEFKHSNLKALKILPMDADKISSRRFLYDKVLFTYEEGFTCEGVIYFFNNHVWADENEILKSISK